MRANEEAAGVLVTPTAAYKMQQDSSLDATREAGNLSNARVRANLGGDEYEGEVHTAFLTWLADRGWCVENYDGETFFIVPAGPDLPEVAK